MIRQTLLATTACLALTLGASAQTAQPRFDAEATQEIETIVRQYLIDHPEVLLEALDSLEAKRATEQVASQKTAIEQNSAALFASPEGTVLGNPEGDVTLVEFFDYNCGYCKQALADMDALIAADPGIRFVLKEIPVLGPQSLAASRVSLAVREVAPERYAEFHRALLGSRGVADEAAAIRVAEDLGLDAAEVRTAMASPAVAAALAESNQLAEGLGINGTPSYVLSDRILGGAVGAEALTAGVANVRDCGSTTC
ncbi:DsbA family protein [Aurantimonas sp. HBX-1]|uniref:DsbA family protein n=1 Tax=Aurantimonas sp. HBX-1 TaxID=2906072 RepID=UPI001F174A6E|nr:DsbA family protein [Aurantimonas sp. HBX-1]UIJ73663.1 DsbA family protein [Aurantimonas sp. HBX-1]